MSTKNTRDENEEGNEIHNLLEPLSSGKEVVKFPEDEKSKRQEKSTLDESKGQRVGNA